MTVDMVLLSNLNVHVGRLCYLDIHKPEDLNKKSIYSQDYIISEVSHVLQANKIVTTATLSTTHFVTNTMADITKLYKT